VSTIAPEHRLGTDIGGTFTDFVAVDGATGELRMEKTLTTPDDPARGIFAGLERLEREQGVRLADAAGLVHGTTLVINALIERKGTVSALVTTEGFRDLLEMRKETRYDVYDLQLEYPEPLVPRRLRFELAERTAADGTVLAEPDPAAVRAIVRKMRAAGVKSVAVVFLHAYANPANEKRVGAWIAEAAPEMAVSLSCEVLPQIKEYERTSTTVANAYVKPLVHGYLERVSDGLAQRGFGGRLHVMQSSGGVVARHTAQDFPIRILESGPAGGVEAARWWGRLAGAADLLCFDMGGTTAKLCTVARGEAVVADEYEAARVYRFKSGSGLAISVPVFDLLEIGTGGGSIARIDSLGLVKVGPHSAGASPGPASYGLGGTEPTVTDADVVLGYLDPGYFLGGAMPLHVEPAARAIGERLASPLAIELLDAAFGIHDIANEDMASAARLHMAERGEDPAALVMVAYGGAGPGHAFGLAQKLGIRRVLVPPAAGVMSALGMLVSDVAMDRVRTFRGLLDEIDFGAVEAAFAELEAEGARMLQANARPTVSRRSADLRYRGQGYNIRVAWPEDCDLATLQARFEGEYAARYGRAYSDVPIELVNLRVVVSLEEQRPFAPRELPAATTPVEEARKGTRRAYFGKHLGLVVCPVYDRYRLAAGHAAPGPAFIEERETTTLVGAGARFCVDRHGILVIDLEAAA
jgi:N-methylhydantoinase A